MKQLRDNQVDERIHDFIAKKSGGRHIGAMMTDWVFSRQTPKGRLTRGYEKLPWSPRSFTVTR